ncbi:primase-helicase family protein, partial [Allosphingosinicella sp.]|uniref:primase-helicase family protein n=1 Tax=Allosphingosinicella sp. TaxID=2823234 RepID=UPI002F066096
MSSRPPATCRTDMHGRAPEGGDEAREVPLGTGRTGGVSLTDFYAYMPTHQYIFAPTGEMWPASSVNARIAPLPLLGPDGEPVVESGQAKKMTATAWLDREKPVEQMTWAPGEPIILRDRLISEGGWLSHPGCSCFNLYRPPTIANGDPQDVKPWLDLLGKIYPSEALHIIWWLAHRIQRPQEKINHALVLGGCQGIGKDTLLEPVKYGVGPWNFIEVSPQHMLGRFNGFVKCVVLRVSEARDLGDTDRFAFYDHMKTYTAAPPDVLRVDEKHLREYSVFNVCGVIITSNHRTDGIYLPADDRRHFVAWSEATRDDFDEGFWPRLYDWYKQGGKANVVAYLRGVDLSGFDPKAPPPKTSAFWAIVDANQAPEDAELADALDRLGCPHATTIEAISQRANDGLRLWLADRKNRRIIRHRLEECGYEPV